jgi:hypothetical protein
MEVIGADVPAHLLPFKGKGEARVRLRQLEQRQSEIELQMRHLAAAFKETFRSPRIVHLVVHGHGGYRHLRWRSSAVNGIGQTYIELVMSEPGRRILESVPVSIRAVLLRFERVRLALNLASSLGQHEVRRLRDYLSKLDAVRRQENQP